MRVPLPARTSNRLTKEGLGIIVCWITTTSGGGVYFQAVAARICLAFYCISVFLTTTLTLLICYRLVSHGRLIKEHLAYEYASTYYAIIALVVESVLPSTLASIAFVISLGLGSQTVGLFGYLYALTMVRGGCIISLRACVFNLS